MITRQNTGDCRDIFRQNLLYQVVRPARYTGGEWNIHTGGWDSARIRVALAYPDLYEVGMSNMALPILYELANRHPGVIAERVFAPWTDMAAILENRKIPLFSLESRHPLTDFDILGFSLAYELTYTNLLNMLHLAHIPLLARERDDSCPLVIAGGTGALNPEPMADFIDFFLVGDGEEAFPEILDRLREMKGQKTRAPKNDLLREVAKIPGVYVPSLYDVSYDGPAVRGITPLAAEAAPRIRRRIVSQLPPPVTRPVVPYIEVIHDRGAVEISRGCSRGCRFCHAGVVYRPVRERPQSEVIQAVEDIIANCGYEEIALVSLSTGDYSHIDELVAKLADNYRNQLAISLPSLRIDRSSIKLVDALSAHRKTGLTFAPEAASKRLQRVINKITSEEVLLETAAAAFDSGWTNFKLYFMAGLPTETVEDVAAIPELVNKVNALGSQARGRRPQIRVSLSTYVPKTHTPFQWVGQDTAAILHEKQAAVWSGLRRKNIKLSWSDPAISLLEAVLSRGDRRLGQVILRAWQRGARFDSWQEYFNFENWRQAFADTGIDPADYANRARDLDEILPWSHIDTGLSAAFLKREYKRALAEIETPDCRVGSCNTCGLQRQQSVCKQRYKSNKV